MLYLLHIRHVELWELTTVRILNLGKQKIAVCHSSWNAQESE